MTEIINFYNNMLNGKINMKGYIDHIRNYVFGHEQFDLDEDNISSIATARNAGTNYEIQNTIDQIKTLKLARKRLKEVKIKETSFDNFLANEPLEMMTAEKISEMSEDLIEELGKEIAKQEKELENYKKQKGLGLKTSILKPLTKLSILLSKLNTGNNTKNFKNNTKQLLKELYNSRQITKLVYNKLIKAIKLIKND